MPDQRFSKNNRLLVASDFKSVFDFNRLKCSQKEVLRPTQESQTPRLGLVIAKKHVRLAVDRNKIKRISRESFRHHKSVLSGMDIVLLGKKGIGDLSKNELSIILEKLWQQLAQRADKLRSKMEHL